MIKNKKIYLGALSLATLAMPIASAISCGSTNNSDGTNPAYDRVHEQIDARIEAASQINSTVYPFENSAFISIPSTKFFETGLGIFYPTGVLPYLSDPQIIASFFVLEVNSEIPSVKIQATYNYNNDATNFLFYSNTTFFTITNFNARFDLSNVGTISPFASYDDLLFADPSKATATEITNALNKLIFHYVDAQMTNAEPVDSKGRGDYTISKLQTSDGKAIADDNLRDNARSYTAVLTATSTSQLVKNSTTVTINLPKIQITNLKTIPQTFTSVKANWTVPSNPKKVSREFVVEQINNDYLKELNKANPKLTFDDIYIIYSQVDVTTLPQWFDLSDPTALVQVKLDLRALPFSNHAYGSSPVIVTLPNFAAV